MTNNKTTNRIIKGVLAVFFWLIIWQIIAMIINKELLVVSPLQTLERLFLLAGQFAFWQNTLYTLGRIMAGFFAAVFCGVVLAVLAQKWEIINTLVRPLIGTIKATPVASFILLALVWMHTYTVPAFCTFLMVLPGVWANVYAGIGDVDHALIDMTRVYRFSKTQKLLKLYIPSVMPFFIAAFTTGMGLGWKAGIAAEVLSLPQIGVGREMYYSKIYIETPDLFAWTLVVIVISMLLEQLFLLLGKRLGKRYNVN